MFRRVLRRRLDVAWAAIAAVLLLFAGNAAPASADTMRTLNVALSCSSGIVPFGLSVNNGSGWYYPNGSSYAVGGTKYFTVFIPAGASSFAFDTMCYYDSAEYNGQAFYPAGSWQGYTYGISPGTSTINMTASLWRGPVYPGPWVKYATVSSLSYS
jgi:hypothetical protein